MKTLSVISPVFNEEEVIEQFYNELKGVLITDVREYDSTILFVVDRSTDRTLEVLERLAATDPALKILALSSRFGHQMSLLAGIDVTRSDVIIMMDSDLQHPPTLIPELLRKFEEGYDIVYTIRQEGNDTGLLKQWTSRFFYRFINLVSQVPILESAADFRLISHRVARVFQEEIRERNQFLRGLFSWVGFRNTGVYFQSRSRAAGGSKYSVGRLLQFAAHGVVSFSKRPLQAAIYVGFLFAFFGFALALITIIQYFTNRSWPPGWTTLAILIPVFSGIQLIFLGVLGEYVGAIFDEVKNRPHYIVEKKVNFRE
jgi:glycosyltransferase involved in cell wall biosynthesis